MRTLRTAILFAAAVLFLASCEDSSNEYFFENPVSGSVLKNVQCVNGSVSYIGFVVDNTEKYGARVMKISGCGQKIDKGFKDDADDKTGIYIGGAGVGVAQIVSGNNVILGVISSGQVDYDHYKNEDKKLESHNGRLVLRTLIDNFQHDKSKDSSVLLDFHPAMVKSDGTGFFVYGTYFGKNFIAYIGTDGSKQVAELDFTVSDMEFSNGNILLFSGTRQLFMIDSELTLTGVWEKSAGEAVKSSGITALTKGRTAVFYNTTVGIFDHNFNKVNELSLPEGYNVTSVSSAVYGEEFLFRSFPKEKMNEKVVIYEAEETETDSDEFTEEVPDEEVSDTALMLLAASDTDDLTDDDITDTDNEVSDDDTASETEVLDAQDGDIIWIASETGTVLAYDLNSNSWMVTYYTEEDEDVSEYSVEMRPYIDSSFTSYPEYGNTNLDNAPFIRKITAVRGLSRSFIYNFTYEGIAEGSRSRTGVLDEKNMIFSDEKADFRKMNYDVGYDRIILLDRKQNSECLIPLNTNVTMDIVTVDSSTEMTVNIEEFTDSIVPCYGDYLTYGVYPEAKYSVTREDIEGRRFVGRADELSTEAGSDESSFDDGNIGISIVRKTDGRRLMFSPLTRRFIEYDVEDREVVEVYK